MKEGYYRITHEFLEPEKIVKCYEKDGVFGFDVWVNNTLEHVSLYNVASGSEVEQVEFYEAQFIANTTVEPKLYDHNTKKVLTEIIVDKNKQLMNAETIKKGYVTLVASLKDQISRYKAFETLQEKQIHSLQDEVKLLESKLAGRELLIGKLTTEIHYSHGVEMPKGPCNFLTDAPTPYPDQFSRSRTAKHPSDEAEQPKVVFGQDDGTGEWQQVKPK